MSKQPRPTSSPPPKPADKAAKKSVTIPANSPRASTIAVPTSTTSSSTRSSAASNSSAAKSNASARAKSSSANPSPASERPGRPLGLPHRRIRGSQPAQPRPDALPHASCSTAAKSAASTSASKKNKAPPSSPSKSTSSAATPRCSSARQGQKTLRQTRHHKERDDKRNMEKALRRR